MVYSKFNGWIIWYYEINISLHIKNIFEEKELEENSVVKEWLTTAKDGKNIKLNFII